MGPDILPACLIPASRAVRVVGNAAYFLRLAGRGDVYIKDCNDTG